MCTTSSIKYFTDYETSILFNKIRKDQSRHAIRNRAIFLVAKYCALRVSEVGMLLVNDYIPKQQQIYCKRKKGSLNNTIRILDEEVISALDEYLFVKPKLYPDSDYLFISQKGNPISRQMLDHLIKNYLLNTDIPKEKQHFHALKHTRAIELGEHCFDIKEQQWWLGHKNVNNTLIYSQFTTHQQDTLYAKYLEYHSQR